MAEPSEADIIAAKAILFGAVMDDQEHSELELSFLRQLVPLVARAIAEARASAEGKWIAVEERMPNDKESVFTWSPDHGIRGLDYVANGEGAAQWFEWEDEPVDDDEAPTHWMPIPEFPRPTPVRQ